MDKHSFRFMENWSLILRGHDYDAPEMMVTCFRGHVRGTQWDEICLSSKIISCSKENVEIEGTMQEVYVFLTESGSKYILLNVDPQYEESYPMAFFRLVSSLMENK